jgi:hypothetical protein
VQRCENIRNSQVNQCNKVGVIDGLSIRWYCCCTPTVAEQLPDIFVYSFAICRVDFPVALVEFYDLQNRAACSRRENRRSPDRRQLKSTEFAASVAS